MFGITVPNFVVAPLMTLIFGVYLKLLPAGGYGDGDLRNLILPTIALVLSAWLAKVSEDGDALVLRQLNPPEDLRVSRDAVLECHLVVGVDQEG